MFHLCILPFFPPFSFKKVLPTPLFFTVHAVSSTNKKEKIWKKEEDTVITSSVTLPKSLKQRIRASVIPLLLTGSLLIMHLLSGAFVDLLFAVDIIYCLFAYIPAVLILLPFFDILYPPRKQRIFHTLQYNPIQANHSVLLCYLHPSSPLALFDILLYPLQEYILSSLTRSFLFNFKPSLKP